MNEVINSVCHALGRSTVLPIEPYQIEYTRKQKNSGLDFDRFINEIELLAGVGKIVSAKEIEIELEELVREQHISKVVMWPSLSLLPKNIENYLISMGVDIISPYAHKSEIAECDLGITETDYAVAETGTLCLYTSYNKPSVVSLLPRIHLALVSPDSFRDDLDQVFSEAKNNPNLVLITGPSRTSDIELTITLGVHGPKYLYAWICSK